MNVNAAARVPAAVALKSSAFPLALSLLEQGEHTVSRELSRNVLLNFSLHEITPQQTLPWVASVETQSHAVPKITPKCIPLCKTSGALICG